MGQYHKFELDSEVLVVATGDVLTVHAFDIHRSGEPAECSVVYELYSDDGANIRGRVTNPGREDGLFSEPELLGDAKEIEAHYDNLKEAAIKKVKPAPPKPKAKPRDK